LEIKHGLREYLSFGNLDISRDFGWSEKYVEAMWLMLQADKPDDYIISSGKSITLREIVHYVFNKLDIDLSAIRIAPELYRPTDIKDIYGSSAKAKQQLGWNYDMDFYEVLDILLLEEEKALLKK
jgi:GDPmannose 4,6-dehydratase